MHKQHDCGEIISKVFLALDGELSADEEKEFQEEIEKCSKCLEQYSIEKAFKQFLAVKISRKHISPKLINEIKEKIKSIVVD